MAYEYSPLQGELQEIRLITVANTLPDSKGSFLSCSLSSVSLKAVADGFIAVSHVWGKDDRTLEITMDDKPLFVTPQLWQFLTLATERVPGRQLWIDAMCINQEDRAEKEKQIPMMGEIYSTAARIIAFLHSLVDSRYYMFDTIAGGSKAVDRSTLNRSNAVEFMYSSKASALALIRLLFHEYWSRMWIVQELRLSKNKEFWWEGLIITGSHMEGIATQMFAYTELSQSDLYSALWLNILGTGISRTAPKNMPSLLDHMNTGPDTDNYQFAQADHGLSLAEMVSET